MSRAVEGGVEHVQANLFGQRSAVHYHGVLAAGFGNQHRIVAAFGQGLVNQACNFGRTGENHAADALVLRECCADVARTQNELQGFGGNAGFVHEFDGIMGNQAGLFGRFGHDGVACGQRGHDFAGKDGQREVPRADGDDCADAAAVRRQGLLGLIGVVAAEIDGFAHFGDGIVQGFACFAYGQHHQLRHMFFKQIGKTAQGGGAFGSRCRLPSGLCGHGGCDGFLCQGGIGKADRTYDIVVVGRIFHRLFILCGACFAIDNGCGAVGLRGRFVEFFLQLLQNVFVAQVDAFGIQTAFAV